MATEESSPVLVDTQDDEQEPLLNTLEATSSEIIINPCIYRVPPRLREMNEKAYTPSLVSIGPFHHGNQALKLMQDLKLSYYNKFLLRTPQQNSAEVYAEAVRDWEDKIRRCYYGSIPMESDEFVRMILTDGCFIIELFVSVLLAGTGESNEGTNFLKKRWPRNDIMKDLILLENQIPFFVLEGLFNLAFPNSEISFHELAFLNLKRSFKSSIYPPNNKMFKKFSYDYFVENHLTLPNGERLQVEHLCGMLRAFYVPNNPPTIARKPNHKVKCSCTANQLHEAGLKFEAHPGKGMFELECSEGVFKMPAIRINKFTETLLRNLIAFEQCHLSYDNYYVTHHMLLLYNLIKTGKDVEILVEAGILESIFGDTNEVATMITDLSQHTVYAGINANYGDLYAKLDKFYNNRYHKYKATFMRDYWSSPWKRISLFGGVLLLLLTFIQTVCSIISLFKK